MNDAFEAAAAAAGEGGTQTRQSHQQDNNDEDDCDSSFDNVLTRTGAGTEAEQEDFTTPNESRLVFWLKMLLLVFLCTCMILVAVAVFFYTTDLEQDEFEERFLDSAEKVLEAIGSTLYMSLGALDSFAVDTVAFAQMSNQTLHTLPLPLPLQHPPWPFVTTPNFAVRAAKLKSLSKAFIVVQHHYVPSHLRQAWEQYSLQHDHWVQQGLEVQVHDSNFFGPQMLPWEKQPTLYNNFEGSNTSSTGPYMVSWQSYPVVPIYPTYNWDVLSFIPFQLAFDQVFHHAKVVMRCSNLPNPEDAKAVTEAGYTNDWAKDYLPKHVNPAEPQIEVYYPMTLESKDYVMQMMEEHQITNEESWTPTVVGVLAPSIHWRNLITDILPDGSGVVAVFRLGESVFTYQILGPNAIYLGQGDRHNGRFNHLVVRESLVDITKSSSTTYSGLPLSRDMENYTIYIYPSTDVEDNYTTINPAYVTALSVMIFAFVSAVFLVYDRCVEKRLRKVIHSTIQSRENVHLLEHLVKERTSKLQASNKQLEQANRRVVQASELQLKHFACMSHEIRTPLNCIVGLSSLMEESEDLNPLQRDSMQMIVSSGDLLRAVVDDVLDYSKLETGNVDVELKRSNLQQSLSSVVHSVEMRGLSTDVTIRTCFDTLIPEFIRTDTRRIQQILYNLLGNAVKFSDKGGVVELQISVGTPGFPADAYSPPRTTSDEEQGKQQAVTVNAERVLRFVVTDHGKGIKKEDYPNIFEPFMQTGERLDNENVYGGTGLGLPITVKLIHAFGGSIAVESQRSEWTRFTVDLPLLDSLVDAATIASGLQDVRVLLVSDEADTRRQIPRNLELYHLYCDSFETMKSLSERLQNQDYLLAERASILLVQEELFDQATFDLVLARKPSALITFGPKFLVGKASGHHRSLTKMLPSALVSSMLACLDQVYKKSATPILTRKTSKPMATASYSTLRFLVAEDNLVNQKVLCGILRRLGIENVVVVDNGRKAVDREAEELFDLVLMDMQMPVMGGVDACRLINERRGGHPRARVIFVTAHVQENFREECLGAGGVGYLAKPCTLKSVQECLESLLT